MMSLPSPNTAALCSVSCMAPYHGAEGRVGRAGGAQAGLGNLPGHCIVSSDPGRGKGSCLAVAAGEELESGFTAGHSPFRCRMQIPPPLTSRRRHEGKDHHVASRRSRCFGDKVACDGRGGFDSGGHRSWSPLPMPHT